MLTLSLVLLCVSVYRATRLVGVDDFPFGPLRDRLEASVGNAHKAEDGGASATLGQRGSAWLLEMVECPWCCGLWLSIIGAGVWSLAVDPDPVWFWWPAAAFTASAFTGAATYVVSLLGGLAEKHGE